MVAMRAHLEESSSRATSSGEMTPLLVAQDSRDVLSSPPPGKATVVQTILNIMKACMGTGCLALAFACQQGGIFVYTIGLAMITAWNVYAVERLCRCLDCVPVDDTVAAEAAASKHHHSPKPSNLDSSLDCTTNDEEKIRAAMPSSSRRIYKTHSNIGSPPPGTSTFGVVAWHAFGDLGLQVMDTMMLILFLGIIVAYFAAVTDFLGDTPFSVGGALGDATLAGLIVGSLSLVPDLGYLSRVSAMGLTVLMVTFLVIAAVGISQNRNEDHAEDPVVTLRLWPENRTGLSRCFGVVVFGYGIVPLTYSFRKSMAEPNKMVPATGIALTFVGFLYVFMGIGLYALFPHVTGEVLHELGGGVVPVLARLAMVWVTITTAPLLVVPCGELVEGKLNWDSDDSTGRMISRLGIVAVSVVSAVMVPGFVQVLSFVGCACVGLIGFCFPPLLHIRLMLLSQDGNPARNLDRGVLILDGLLLTWGVFATIISTLYTIGKL